MGILADIAVEPVATEVITTVSDPASNTDFGFATLLVFLAVLGIESVVLRLMRWGSFGNTTLDAFLMNFATTLLGLLFVRTNPSAFLPFLVAWSISVAVEAIVLLLLRRRTVGRTLGVSALANIFSYLFLGLLLILT